ncbi:MAG: hypothetical protein COZ85_01830 [Candidatus Moranbacteria bacterium CG_4_8_14_3_um_filter_34_16]|nr:MAG: hypothetical protein COT31_00040 [Candidatus Moranbacteria bacterium CG08_land_8_20_14_0_20_34_16]PIW95095.1 MAG: hypothetical protein COZ85_01830 [Candidatus Moranbacteria bacterium CG_4_8_14_3_um_filter_34_16]
MQKKIILFISLLLFFSSFWLFYSSEKKTDPAKQNDWWSLYFSVPKETNSNFTIENYSNQNNFHWKELSKNKVIQENDIQIKKGEKSQIKIKNPEEKEKVIIQVTHKEEKKEIYKNLN